MLRPCQVAVKVQIRPPAAQQTVGCQRRRPQSERTVRSIGFNLLGRSRSMPFIFDKAGDVEIESAVFKPRRKAQRMPDLGEMVGRHAPTKATPLGG